MESFSKTVDMPGLVIREILLLVYKVAQFKQVQRWPKSSLQDQSTVITWSHGSVMCSSRDADAAQSLKWKQKFDA